MHQMHPASDLLRGLLTREKPKAAPAPVALYDAADDETTGSAQSTYANTDLRLKAVAIAQQFAATSADDLDSGESLADRLLSLVVGAVDSDIDGELSDDEAAVAQALLENLYDYLASKGVSDEDCTALLNDWDASAAERVKDLLADTATSDEDAAADMESFAFDENAEQSIFDSAGEPIYDAVYKKKVVVRQGRKVRINKRVSGVVRLSAKQKVAIKKMQRKSHTAVATIQRMKSLKVRKRAGL